MKRQRDDIMSAKKNKSKNAPAVGKPAAGSNNKREKKELNKKAEQKAFLPFTLPLFIFIVYFAFFAVSDFTPSIASTIARIIRRIARATRTIFQPKSIPA